MASSRPSTSSSPSRDPRARAQRLREEQREEQVERRRYLSQLQRERQMLRCALVMDEDINSVFPEGLPSAEQCTPDRIFSIYNECIDSLKNDLTALQHRLEMIKNFYDISVRDESECQKMEDNIDHFSRLLKKYSQLMTSLRNDD
jgi:DNA repair ATPase RecN